MMRIGLVRLLKRHTLISVALALALVTTGFAGVWTSLATPAGAETISSPTPGSALNDNTGIQSSPVSCGFSDPNGPFTFAPGVVGTIEPATSMSLPSGSSDYIYVGSDAGGNPLTSISWNEDLSVVAAYSGNKSISIGQSPSDSGSFDANGTTNVAVAGLALSGYSVVNKYTASSSSNGESLSLPFTTSSGDLVVVAVGGEGVGLLQESGGSLNTLVNDTYSECGSDVIASAAMLGGFLSSGSYTASFSETTYSTNAGAAIGAVAYILAPGSTPPPSCSTVSGIAPAESVTLPSGCSQYFYVGTTTGGYPRTASDDISDISWTPDLSVNSPWSGDLGDSIGRSSSNVGSYSSPVVNYAIAGAGVSGYTVANVYPAQNGVLGPGTSGGGDTLAPGATLSLPFTTSSGDEVLILVGGQGTGTITMSGISATTLQNQTYSEGGSNNYASAAIYSASLGSGSYTAQFTSTSSLNTSGNALGAVAYVLSPGSAPPGPTVTNVNPDSGPPSGGTSVTITGSGLSTTSTTVDFGEGDPATDVTCSSSSTCTAITPAGTGTVDVTATVGSLSSNPNPPNDQYTFIQSAPNSVLAVAGNDSAVIGWIPPTSPPTGTTLTGYTITSEPPLASLSTSSCLTTMSMAPCEIVSGLSNGTSYTFEVAALYSNGASAISGASNSITPGPPQGECGLQGPAVGVAIPGATVADALNSYLGNIGLDGVSVSDQNSNDAVVLLGSGSAALSVPCNTSIAQLASDVLGGQPPLNATVTTGQVTSLALGVTGQASFDTGDIVAPVGVGVAVTIPDPEGDVDVASLGVQPYVHLSLSGAFDATVQISSAAEGSLSVPFEVVPSLPPQLLPVFTSLSGTTYCAIPGCLTASLTQANFGAAADFQFGAAISGDILGEGIDGHIGANIDAIGGGTLTNGSGSAWGMICGGVGWDVGAKLSIPDVVGVSFSASGTLIEPQQLFATGPSAVTESPPSGCPAKEAVAAVPQSSTPGFPNPTTTYDINASVTDSSGNPVTDLPVEFSDSCASSVAGWLSFGSDCGNQLGDEQPADHEPAVELTNTSGVATDTESWQPGLLLGLTGTPVVEADVPGIDDDNTVQVPLASTATSNAAGGSATAGGPGTPTSMLTATASGGTGTVAVAQLNDAPSGSNSAFQGGADYVDVSISDGNTFGSVLMTACDQSISSSSVLEWNNPNVDFPEGQWQAVSPQSAVTYIAGSSGFFGFGATPGCLEFTVTNSTTPSLQQLQGTLFAISVVGSPVTVSLASSVNPVTAEQPLTLTATVAPTTGSGTPIGFVRFWDGATPLGYGRLDGQATDQATLETKLGVGPHDLFAVFEGNTQFASSAPALFVENVVSPPPPTVTNVSPSQGEPFSYAEIEGTNLASGTGEDGNEWDCIFACTRQVSVNFGGTEAIVLFDANDKIGVLVPPGQGTVDVTVQVDGVTSSTSTADQFTYISPPPCPTGLGWLSVRCFAKPGSRLRDARRGLGALARTPPTAGSQLPSPTRSHDIATVRPGSPSG